MKNQMYLFKYVIKNKTFSFGFFRFLNRPISERQKFIFNSLLAVFLSFHFLTDLTSATILTWALTKDLVRGTSAFAFNCFF